jgi:hypothetical protein
MIPPIGAAIDFSDSKIKDTHEKLFGIEVEDGEVPIYTKIKSLPFVLLDPEQELKNLQQLFAGNAAAFNRLYALKKQRINLNAGDISSVDMAKLHENSLSALLYEKKSDDADVLNEDFSDLVKRFSRGSKTPKEESEYVVAVTLNRDELEKGLDTSGKKSKFSFGSEDIVDNPASMELQKSKILPNNEDALGFTINQETIIGAALVNSPSIKRIEDPLKGKRISSNDGKSDFDIEVSRENLQLIANSVLDQDRNIDGDKLLKFFPKITYNIKNADIQAYFNNRFRGKGSIKQDEVDLTFDPKDLSKIRYSIPGTNFKIDISTKNNYEEFFTTKAASKRSEYASKFEPFHSNTKAKNEIIDFLERRDYTSERFRSRVAEIVDIFNNATKNDSATQKTYKAANYIAAIFNKLGFDVQDDTFYNADFKLEYTYIANLYLDEDITDSSGGFDLSLQEKNQEEDADSTKSLMIEIENLPVKVSNLRVKVSKIPKIDFERDDLDFKKDCEPSFQKYGKACNDIYDHLDTLLTGSSIKSSNEYKEDILNAISDIREDLESYLSYSDVEKCKELLSYYGQNEDFLAKVVNILKSVVNDDLKHTTISDQGRQLRRTKRNLSNKELLKSIQKTAQNKMGKLGEFLESDFNINGDFEINNFLGLIKKHLSTREKVKKRYCNQLR